jgi:hypothetical protein
MNFTRFVCSMKWIGFVLAVLTICSASSLAATQQCSYTFTSGANNTYLKYCVTVNGNIPQIESPLGERLQFGWEGYGLCNESPAAEYHDYGNEDTGNWNPPTLVSLTTTAVKIARTTSDGNWTLTQTITQVPSTASIRIAMALHNNTSTSRVAYLVRYDAPGPAGGGGYLFASATRNSAFEWWASSLNQPNEFGIALQTVGTSPGNYTNGFAQNVVDGPNACAFAYNSPGGPVLQAGSLSLVMANVATIPAHGTKTFTISYKGM